MASPSELAVPEPGPWTAPGPGPWELDTAHFPRPVTSFAADGMMRGFERGFAESTARYGLLLSHFKPAIVNGFYYQQPVAFGAPEGAMGPPPKLVLWLLTRLHPKLRARIADCERAFENKQWRIDLEQWDSVEKPRAIAAHRAIQAVDPATLSSVELCQHLARAHAHMEAMFGLHHRFTVTCTVATGEYLADTCEWTGVTPGEALVLLRGTSPISNGVAASELMRLGDALAKSAEAQALLSSCQPALLLEALLGKHGEVGEAARDYLDVVRFRSVGYDVSDRNCGEMPELLVRAIRSAVDRGSESKALAERELKEKALRERVPTQHRSRFDELLEEARLVNRLRDERGVYSDGWSTGLARRALLEAGARVARDGKIEHAEHAVDLTLSELTGLLGGAARPTASEVAQRVLWRTTKTAADAPAFLNAMPAPPPSATVLPKAARRAARAVEAVITNLFKDAGRSHEKQIVRGLSVNAGVYEGTARLVMNAADFERIQQGDVLVTAATSPYFNVVLPLLGGLVTDRGGQLCHAAVVAREYGIPGIVGTKDATRLIPDGARVRLDGLAGEVTILSTGVP